MKKTNLSTTQRLSRRQQTLLLGGTADETSCTAECGKNSLGQRLIVTCKGSYCVAKDNYGCSSIRESKTCLSAIVAS